MAAALQVDPETVRRWIKRKALPALELGETTLGYRIANADVEAFMRRRGMPSGVGAGLSLPPRRLTVADIILPEPLLPEEETADEMIETIRRWRREGGGLLHQP